MAGVEGVEPTPTVLETDVLPLYYTPMCLLILSYWFAFRKIFKDNKSMRYRFDKVKEEYYTTLGIYKYILRENNSPLDGCGRIEMFEEIENWHLECIIFENENTVPPGYSIAFEHIYLNSKNECVGMVNFRPKAMEHPNLKEYGGHVGYNVRPDLRGQGIGKKMLKDFLKLCKKEYAKKFNLDKILITCTKHNDASRKVILANGGEFEREVYYPAGDCYLERYWFKL